MKGSNVTRPTAAEWFWHGRNVIVTSVAIIGISLALFVYWFRYICLLVLQNGSNIAVAHRVAQTIRLSFPRVRESLDEVSGTSLDDLFTALEQDYRTLNDLLPRSKSGSSIERRLLDLDFQLMRVVYRVGRTLGIPIGRTALKEMSSILNFYATAVGQ